MAVCNTVVPTAVSVLEDWTKAQCLVKLRKELQLAALRTSSKGMSRKDAIEVACTLVKWAFIASGQGGDMGSLLTKDDAARDPFRIFAQIEIDLSISAMEIKSLSFFLITFVLSR